MRANAPVLSPHHMGDALVAELLRHLGGQVGDLPAIDPTTSTRIQLKSAFPLLADVSPAGVHPNASLDKLPCGRCFDGMHDIDCSIELDQTVVALELKLGLTQLRLEEFRERFSEKVLRRSHNDKRVSGSMVAVLDGNGSTIDEVEVVLRSGEKSVDRKWALVVCRRTLDFWTGNGQRDITKALGVRQLGAVLSLEEIAAKVGVDTARELAMGLVKSSVDSWFSQP